MHVAAAEFAKADYFVTCDDDLLKTAAKHKEKLKINIMSVSNSISGVVKNA